MSPTATAPTSAQDSDWQLADERHPRQACLEIRLRQQVYILPYFRFTYAEGTPSLLRIFFASHSVAITGHGLGVLHSALAAHRVLSITQPTENDAKFRVGPGITSIVVTDLEAGQDQD
jgi:hypothetical protein